MLFVAALLAVFSTKAPCAPAREGAAGPIRGAFAAELSAVPQPLPPSALPLQSAAVSGPTAAPALPVAATLDAAAASAAAQPGDLSAASPRSLPKSGSGFLDAQGAREAAAVEAGDVGAGRALFDGQAASEDSVAGPAAVGALEPEKEERPLRLSGHWSVRRGAAWLTPAIANPVFATAAALAPIVWMKGLVLYPYINPFLRSLRGHSAAARLTYDFINGYALDLVFMPAAIGWFIGSSLVATGIAIKVAGWLRPSIRGRKPGAASAFLASRWAAGLAAAWWLAAFFAFFAVKGFPGWPVLEQPMMVAWLGSWFAIPLGLGLAKLGGWLRAGFDDVVQLYSRLVPAVAVGYFAIASIFLEMYVLSPSRYTETKDPWDILAYFIGTAALLLWWSSARKRLSLTSLRRRAVDFLHAVSRDPQETSREIGSELSALDSIAGRGPAEPRWDRFRSEYASFLERLASGHRQSGLGPERYVRQLARRDPMGYQSLAEALRALRDRQ